MSIENHYFDPTGRQLAFELLLKPLLGMQTDEAQILGTRKYLAGDTLTLADLYHLPWVYALTEKANLDLIPSRPNVASLSCTISIPTFSPLNRWAKDISERPSWQAVKDGA
ncbi:hypothetical protein B0H13DRAFT_2338569 [Mycena leptocephala]|nr:hypothetical protein B0H13DRAFT_2338569 [Mycena leptocephala]